MLILCLPLGLAAQVTTSSLSGTIQDSKGVAVQGASIKATHTPSGTVYNTLTRSNGLYNLVNMIPGGPYTVEVTFVGYKAVAETNITLTLGDNSRFDATLAADGETLSDVVVTATRVGTNARRKTGASTSIGLGQISTLPTLSRSIQDFTRLTPQANGNSFGGASNRFNNITIDGAVNNDVFGLSGSGTPGGQAATQPISLDAIQEFQVVLAPYDITYGNFTGAGVNAVTRSGTNNLEGSAYYFVRNQNTIGSDPISKVKSTDFSDKQYGIRVGGPIIKNKLFFFVNGELARRNAPTIFNAGETNALLTGDEANQLSTFVRNTYNYDPGTIGAFDAQTQSDKVFARIDWNINSKHRLTIRHNYISAFDDNISRSRTLFRYGNNTYRFNNKQNITVLELRSQFSNTVSNNLILGMHRIRDYRSTYGELFPSIEITANSGTIQLGSERSSTANELDQNIFEITDNVKIFKGKHTFTVGTHNEFFSFRNLFINNLNGRWRFGSLNDFYAGRPRQFDVTYSANKAANARPAAEFDAAQLGFYIQDEIQLTQKFRLSAGLRVDVPIISTDPGYNRAVDSTFGADYSTLNTPSGQLLWAPRVGFNYDVAGDRSVILRGGAGIFSGRVPFVWISNQYGNTGLLLKTTSQTDNTPTAPPYDVNGGQFDPNVDNQSNIGSAGNSFEVNLSDKKFKLPQVLRFNLGTDIRLPGGFGLTFDAMYSKTLNNVFYQDINLTAPAGVVDPAYNNGADTRIAYGTSNAARRRNPAITNAIYLTNTNEGHTVNIGGSIDKTINKFYARVSYNYNDAQDVNSGASSTALSNWEFVQVVGNPNAAPLSTSNYQMKHRFTGLVSYNIEYAKHLKTSISLFYQGTSGTPFTYVVNGDLNSDGRFGNDLMYVPANASEIKFVDLLNSAGNAIVTTAQQQSDAFMAFVNADKYLSEKKGQYVERNGRSTPWEHVIDARIAQDFFIKAGEKRHALQITFDVFNITNLINRDWGRQWGVTNQAFNILSTVNRTTGAFQGKGYNYNPCAIQWRMNFGSRFQGQFGLRYRFN
ncbi:MAG: carboxypeptidase regulatory-like domain-containing protein [Flavitalea sp.]